MGGKVGQKSIKVGHSPVPASILLLVRKACWEKQPIELRGNAASPLNLSNGAVIHAGVLGDVHMFLKHNSRNIIFLN